MHEVIVLDALTVVIESLAIVSERFKKIKSADDFINSDEGILLMDSISMRLQLVGEKIKKVDKMAPGLLEQHGIETYPIIRFRDFISHHYDRADHEALFDLCKNDLPDLQEKLSGYLKSNSGDS